MRSWELGTETEALLELDCSPMSVYGNAALPPTASIVPEGVISIVQPLVTLEPAAQQQLILDGAAGDPCSLGVAVLIANITLGSTSGVNYTGAAQKQLNAILYDTPRTPDGAISHRTEDVQLWSDFVYMAPPFIAYFGAITNNQTLLQAAYDQCRLYRQYLLYSNGCWQHIVLGTNGTQDTGRWATGNGWAAAGMLRVYATISHSAFASAMASQMSDLATWVNEIQSCAWSNLQSGSALLHNYIDQPGTFLDAASTSIMAAITYRYAALGLGSQFVNEAELVYQAISSNCVNTTTGIISPVVDPENFPTQLNQTGVNNQTNTTNVSPEAQAFVLLMEASRRDYMAGNVSTAAQPSQQPATASSSPTNVFTTSTSRAGAMALEPVLDFSKPFMVALCLVGAMAVGGLSIL